MKTDPIKTKLTRLGLTDSEGVVYLAMLKLGANTVQNIAKTARLSRTATYQIISALEQKGLASSYLEKKKRLFSAEDPDTLERFFKQRIQQLEHELVGLSNIVPELRILQHDRGQPRVRFFRGNEGIRALFKDLSSASPRELLEVTNLDTVREGLDVPFLREQRATVDTSNMNIKVLYRGTLNNKVSGVEYIPLPESIEQFHGNIWIYSDRIAFTRFSGAIEVVIIDNLLFANTMRAIFLSLWECEKSKMLQK